MTTEDCGRKRLDFSFSIINTIVGIINQRRNLGEVGLGENDKLYFILLNMICQDRRQKRDLGWRKDLRVLSI